MSAKRTFVLTLKEEMARQGVSRGDLARVLECTEANVAQMLNERRTFWMRLYTVERLADALGCGIVLVLTTQPGAETVIAQWREEAGRKGVSFWEWLAAAVDRSWGWDTVSFWLRQGFPTRQANALANAGIRSWGQLAALNRNDLLALRNLGKVGVREIEERLARHREEASAVNSG